MSNWPPTIALDFRTLEVLDTPKGPRVHLYHEAAGFGAIFDLEDAKALRDWLDQFIACEESKDD